MVIRCCGTARCLSAIQWLEPVSEPLSAGDLERLWHSVARDYSEVTSGRGKPQSGQAWNRACAQGRPRKEKP